jgi:hypothetical protein
MIRSRKQFFSRNYVVFNIFSAFPMLLEYDLQMYSFFSISEHKTYLKLKNVGHQTKKGYHQSNVQYTDQSQRTLNGTRQMVVCYEWMSVHYKIIHCILYLTMLAEIILTYLSLSIRNDRTYCVDYNVVICIAEQRNIMF